MFSAFARASARRFSATAESTVAAYPGTVQAMHWISGGAMVNPSELCGLSLSSTLWLFSLTVIIHSLFNVCFHAHLTPVELCWPHASRAILAVVEKVQPGRKKIQNEQHVFAQKFRHPGVHGAGSSSGRSPGI